MPITFETDSVAAGEIREPELAATWASLRIRLDDSVITRVVGRRAQTVRDQVYVPLYPLPESLVSNWWFLLHEVGNPVTNDDDAFRRPHALVSVRDGYAFPKLQVASSGARTVLAWTSESLRWANLDYQRENYVWIDRNDFRQTCADLVDRVIRRLVACGIDGTFLREWAPVQAADEDRVSVLPHRYGAGVGSLRPDRKERVPVDEYTIEHILPQNENLSATWREILGPEWRRVQETWLHTLGNLTLTGYNPEYSDRPFDQKRDMRGGFRESPLRLNDGLSALNTWNEAAIRQRASRLAEQAVRVWAGPALPAHVLESFRPAANRPAGYNLDFHELHDPRRMDKDVTNLGRWGNGNAEVYLSEREELAYVMGLVRQAFERQMRISEEVEHRFRPKWNIDFGGSGTAIPGSGTRISGCGTSIPGEVERWFRSRERSSVA